MAKKALILAPCTGVHRDITNLIWEGRTTLATDRLQTLPLMRCLKANDYDTQVLSYNILYTFEEIKKIKDPDICFIGKMRHDSKKEDGDRFCQFHLATILNLKRKGAKIACIYSDNVCEYNDQGGEMYKNILYLSDLIITPSKKLRLHASNNTQAHTEFIIIPDPEILDKKPFKRFLPGEPLKLIWFGHNKNMQYLQRELPSIIENSDKSTSYVLTILGSIHALNSFKQHTLNKLPKASNWTLRLTPWDVNRQPRQLSEELADSHISLIPSDPDDPLKNGVSHNRLTDSIQSGCIAIASPMDSYKELSEACLLGKNFPKLLQESIDNNKALCEKYEKSRQRLFEKFDPRNNLELWQKAIKTLEKAKTLNL